MDKFTPAIEQVSADERGEIYVVHLPDERELVLIHSVAGSKRGGHAHNVDEVVVMLTGAMAYYKRKETGSEWSSMLKAGDASFNEAGLIHMGIFQGDSWLIEYKKARKGEWRNLDYKPWREKVEVDTAGR